MKRGLHISVSCQTKNTYIHKKNSLEEGNQLNTRDIFKNDISRKALIIDSLTPF